MEMNGIRLKHVAPSDSSEITYLHFAGICPAQGQRLYPSGKDMIQAVENWVAANPQKMGPTASVSSSLSSFGNMAMLLDKTASFDAERKKPDR